MTIEEYLAKITNEDNRAKLASLLEWVKEEFPELQLQIKWSQPMFILDKTFVFGFSVATHHIAVSPEKQILDNFVEQIDQAKYSRSKMIFRIRWDQAINHQLLHEIISASMVFKRGSTKFWT